MNKPNVLFLVHVEEMFRGGFPDNLYPSRLQRSASAKKYDRVIILDSDLSIIIRELQDVDAEVQIWSWGYEPHMFPEEEQKWVIPSYGHEWTWIPNWLRDEIDYYKNANLFVGGGYSGSCLEDWEVVLANMSLYYERVEGLIYG